MVKKIIAITALVLLLGKSHVVYSADTLSEGSLAISPFLIEAEIKPGQTHNSTIDVLNVTDNPLPITVSINDFVPSGDQGSVRFLDTGQTSHPSFSLASWITITKQPEFVIAPKAKTSIDFTITVPIDAEPGTHYGGLLFSANESPIASANTSVVRKVGALILVATGKTDASGKIETFFSNKRFYTAPQVEFTSVFTNTGNVHLAPKGQVSVRNTFGKLIGEAHLNENAQFVLPKNSRQFTDTVKRPWMFGRYTATLTYWYGNPKLESRAVINFWVIPVRLLLTYGGGSLILLLLVYIGIKRYNRWVIARSETNR